MINLIYNNKNINHVFNKMANLNFQTKTHNLLQLINNKMKIKLQFKMKIMKKKKNIN